MAGPVQQIAASATGSGATVVATLPGAPTQGNILIACCGVSLTTASVSSIAQTGVTWTLLTSAKSNTGKDAEIWVGTVGAGAAAAATVTVSATLLTRAVNISEWPGALYTAVEDATPGHLGNAGSTNPTSGTTTTVTANDLLIATLSSGVAPTVPTSSFVALTPAQVTTACFVSPSYREVNATGAYSTGWTESSTPWDMVIVALRGVPTIPVKPVIVTQAAVSRASLY